MGPGRREGKLWLGCKKKTNKSKKRENLSSVCSEFTGSPGETIPQRDGTLCSGLLCSCLSLTSQKGKWSLDIT